MLSKLAFAKLVERIVQSGRGASRAAKVSPEARRAAEAAARRGRLLAQRTPSGYPKYMEVPRAAYGSPPSAKELASGKQVAQALERASKETTLSGLSTAFSGGKTLAYKPMFEQPSLMKAVPKKTPKSTMVARDPNATAVLDPPVFEQGLREELAKIRAMR